MLQFKKGDVVWYVPYSHLIAIKCIITEVESDLSCDLDEPVGHSLYPDQLYTSKEDAAEVLKEKYLEALEYSDTFVDDRDSLIDYRLDTINFIVRTHAHQNWSDAVTHVNDLLNCYKDKSNGTDWFNYSQIEGV